LHLNNDLQHKPHKSREFAERQGKFPCHFLESQVPVLTVRPANLGAKPQNADDITACKEKGDQYI
jgi:hypothetical protein